MAITNNESLEIAATQALELMDGGSDNWEDIIESYKMVFVVNTALEMGVGKTAAQVCSLNIKESSWWSRVLERLLF